jgi:hypothetical protein
MWPRDLDTIAINPVTFKGPSLRHQSNLETLSARGEDERKAMDYDAA